MARDLDTALFRSFVTVVAEGGMTAAARRLHLTQAAVSQQIKRLEDALGAQLFVRGNRALRPSPAGTRILDRAREIVRLSDELQEEMSSPPMTGAVRLGAPTDIVNSFLPLALRTFARDHPRVDVTLVCRTSPLLVEDWAAGKIDIALVEEPVSTARTAASRECLLLDRLVWIGAPGGAAHRRTPLPVSLSNDSNALRPAIVRSLQSSNIAFRTVSEVGTIETVSATVRTDLAVTALLRSTVPADVEILGAQAGLPDLPHFEVNMLGANQCENSVTEALCTAIRGAFQKRSENRTIE